MPESLRSSSMSPELIRRIGFSLGGLLCGSVKSSLEGMWSPPNAISVRGFESSISELFARGQVRCQNMYI